MNVQTLRSLRLLVALCLSGLAGCRAGQHAEDERKVELAEEQVDRIADELDQQTSTSGVYVRAKEGEINERDPWGTKIRVDYSQGGVAEVLTVRSAGPDRKFQSDDDVLATGMAVNLKGIGEGIKENAEETAAKAAKGVVKGALEGVKEAIQESRPPRTEEKEKPPRN